MLIHGGKGRHFFGISKTFCHFFAPYSHNLALEPSRDLEIGSPQGVCCLVLARSGDDAAGRPQQHRGVLLRARLCIGVRARCTPARLKIYYYYFYF